MLLAAAVVLLAGWIGGWRFAWTMLAAFVGKALLEWYLRHHDDGLFVNAEDDDGLGAAPEAVDDTLSDDDDDDLVAVLLLEQAEGKRTLRRRCSVVDCCSAAAAWALRATRRYVLEARDVSKPLAVLLGSVVLLVLLRVEITRDDVHKVFDSPKTVFHLAFLVAAVAALLDLWRRSLLVAFSLLRRVFFGKLAEDEAKLLRPTWEAFAVAFGAALFSPSFAPYSPALAASVAAILFPLSRLARVRLRKVVERTLGDDDDCVEDLQALAVRQVARFCGRHVRLFVLNAALQLVTFAVARHSLATSPVLETAAFFAWCSQRTTEALCQHVVVAWFEFAPAVRALLLMHHRRRGDSKHMRQLASYYVALAVDVFTRTLVLLWSLADLTSRSDSVGGLAFFVLRANNVFALAARLNRHRAWRSRFFSTTAPLTTKGLRVATEADVRHYDDLCVVCHDVLLHDREEPCNDPPLHDDGLGSSSAPGKDRLARRRERLAALRRARENRRAARGQRPVKLPRCKHLFHLSCLRLYLAQAAAPACPICCKPIAPPPPPVVVVAAEKDPQDSIEEPLLDDGGPRSGGG